MTKEELCNMIRESTLSLSPGTAKIGRKNIIAPSGGSNNIYNTGKIKGLNEKYTASLVKEIMKSLLKDNLTDLSEILREEVSGTLREMVKAQFAEFLLESKKVVDGKIKDIFEEFKEIYNSNQIQNNEMLEKLRGEANAAIASLKANIKSNKNNDEELIKGLQSQRESFELKFAEVTIRLQQIEFLVSKYGENILGAVETGFKALIEENDVILTKLISSNEDTSKELKYIYNGVVSIQDLLLKFRSFGLIDSQHTFDKERVDSFNERENKLIESLRSNEGGAKNKVIELMELKLKLSRDIYNLSTESLMKLEEIKDILSRQDCPICGKDLREVGEGKECPTCGLYRKGDSFPYSDELYRANQIVSIEKKYGIPYEDSRLNTGSTDILGNAKKTIFIHPNKYSKDDGWIFEIDSRLGQQSSVETIIISRRVQKLSGKNLKCVFIFAKKVIIQPRRGGLALKLRAERKVFEGFELKDIINATSELSQESFREVLEACKHKEK